jgi:hypothetical protein
MYLPFPRTDRSTVELANFVQILLRLVAPEALLDAVLGEVSVREYHISVVEHLSVSLRGGGGFPFPLLSFGVV